jgi:hypothetical protein
VDAVRFVVVVVVVCCAAACSHAGAPNVDDALVACESLSGGAVSCNEELLVAAAEGADKDAVLHELVAGAKASNVETSAGEIDVDGKMVPATRVELSTDDVDYRGSLIASAGKVSLCLVAVDVAPDPCPRVHAALLAGGRALLEKRVQAAKSLPLAEMPRVPAGCDVDRGERGEFRIDCDAAVVSVHYPEGGASQALDDFTADALEDGFSDGDNTQIVAAGTCTLLGQTAPCVTITGSWTVRAAVAQTRLGRRLVECGVEGTREPNGDLCPRVSTTASTRTVSKPTTTE